MPNAILFFPVELDCTRSNRRVRGYRTEEKYYCLFINAAAAEVADDRDSRPPGPAASRAGRENGRPEKSGGGSRTPATYTRAASHSLIRLPAKRTTAAAAAQHVVPSSRHGRRRRRSSIPRFRSVARSPPRHRNHHVVLRSLLTCRTGRPHSATYQQLPGKSNDNIIIFYGHF